MAYRIGCGVLIAVHAVLLTINAWRLSPVMDEYGHLYAGVRLWRDGDTSIFCVNPPLVRAVAGGPGYLMGLRTVAFVQQTMGGREEFSNGRLAYQRDPRGFTAALLGGRLAVSLFSIAGLALVLFATRHRYGFVASLICGTLWAFQSEWIAHGSLLTNDVPVSVGILGALLAFLHWLKRPSAIAALTVGIVFAVALLCKYSAVALLPIFGVFTLICRPVTWRSLLGHASLFAVTVWLLFCAAYGFSDMGRPLGSFLFTSPVLQGHLAPEAIAGNVFRDTVWATVPVPLPADAFVGVDVQMGELQRGAPSFMAGRRGTAWWFYLYALAVKLPLGTLLAMATTIIVIISRRDRIGVDEILMLTFVYLFLVITAASGGIGQHHRYVFPVIGPMILLIGFGWHHGRAITKSMVAFGTVATIAFCFFAAPNWLPAFNLAAGGTGRGHHHLFNDATDWGQDLQRLADFSNRQGTDVRLIVFPRRNLEANLRAAGITPRVVLTRHPMDMIEAYRVGPVADDKRPLRVICSKTEVSMDLPLRQFIATHDNVVDLWGSHVMFDVVGKN